MLCSNTSIYHYIYNTNSFVTNSLLIYTWRERGGRRRQKDRGRDRDRDRQRQIKKRHSHRHRDIDTYIQIDRVCLCLTSLQQRGHLERAPHLLSLAKDVQLGKYTVPTGNRTRRVAVH